MAGPLSEVVRQLRRLAGLRPAAALSDSHLLERFLTQKDETAFETLLARHGPMVLGVCRSLLSDVHEAEDAFAATFLVFVRKAASIGRRELLGNWLYGVAHRVALRARANAVRRRAQERGSIEMLAANSSDEIAARERARVVHEELNLLPARYRAPLILSYLEGKTQEEVAQELDCTPGAVRGRLERGRERLRARLASRGLGLSAAVLAANLESRTLTAAVPQVLFQSTLKTALIVAAGGSAAGAISTSVAVLVEGVVHAMFMTKVKIAVALLSILGLFATGAGVVTYGGLHAQAPPAQAPAAQKEEVVGPDVARERLRDDLINKLNAGQAVTLPDMPADRLNAMLAALRDGSKLTSLLKDQYEAAHTESEARWNEFLAGRGTLDIFQGACRRLLQAEFDLSDKKTDRLAAMDAQLLRTQLVEAVNKQRFDAGRINIQDYAVARFQRIRAEIMLERAKASRATPELID
jgi:RNA polymerase sigma factor (sigma-70 family)